jgi:predicted nucleic acid-binding protein
MNKIALDTNIVIHNHGTAGDAKELIAERLLADTPVISAQVISEYLNVMKRILKIKKGDLLEMCADWLEACHVQPVTLTTIKLARRLVDKYDFQIFDGIIVASSLEAGCDILYSEDMQDGLIVEKLLRIENPYL